MNARFTVSTVTSTVGQLPDGSSRNYCPRRPWRPRGNRWFRHYRVASFHSQPRRLRVTCCSCRCPCMARTYKRTHTHTRTI
uniref:Uncharacterized protein n=1 Tax=Picea glauca TaxID=3330 RepID=A0A101LVX5_PICGL|nr:hypothetical protein ABT39_MTgene1812 [Picea glauca]QHR91832.1 hypothetical protein Q903MT_gene5868 [Picea sitchensis]